MRALIGRLHREQRGITLVELIVAMAITSLLLTLVGSFFVSMTKAQQTVAAVNDSTRQGSTSIAQVTRYLREATRLQTGKATTLAAFTSATTSSKAVFYSAVDTTTASAGVTRVTLDASAGRLDMTLERMKADSNGYYSSTSVSSTRTIRLADVARTTTPFGYVDANGAAVTDSTKYDSIRSVKVTLTVGATRGSSANDTSFAVTVNLRNLDYGTATG